MKRTLWLGLVALGLGLLCVAPPSGAGPSFAQTPGPALTSDVEFAKIAASVPGFGGLYYDERGVANVHLVDLTRASAFTGGGAQVVVHQGQYDWRDLMAYKKRLNDVMALPGVVMLDVDERTNRVRVGVDRESGAAALETVSAGLTSFGVPRAAVLVEPVDAVHQLATVRDRVRPVPGGVQIGFGGFLCTLGFNVTRGGVAGYVTNSHCTNIQGGVEGTVHGQNTNTAANRIGVENADPTYFTGGSCPAGRRCRFSDSSFGRYDSSSLRQQARIARTTAPNSLTISTTASRFVITGTANFPSTGQTLNKMGRTTGWSRGTVAFTCTNINVSGSNITQLCQDGVNARVAGGDSGSPVFSAGTGTGNVNATLYGILWGGNQAGTQYIMSAWQNIASELGAMSVL